MDVAIDDIALAPHADLGHRTVQVTLKNRAPSGFAGNFRIGLIAKRTDGQVWPEVFSDPLTLKPGASTTVQSRLGGNWIKSGVLAAHPPPSSVPEELSTATDNHTIFATFCGPACCG